MSQAYEDFTSSDEEWEPNGGWPDATLTSREEADRRNAWLIKHHWKGKALEAKEAEQ